MWSHEYSLQTDLDTAALWAVLGDIPGWASWNEGVAAIEVDGPLALETTFRMTPPGEDPITSVIVDLQPGRLLTDLTEFGGMAIRVEHRLEATAGGTTIIYGIEVTGDAPDEMMQQVGAAVSADFPQVMAGLVAAARSRTPVQ